jgi:CheY-like chemotaxis protein
VTGARRRYLTAVLTGALGFVIARTVRRAERLERLVAEHTAELAAVTTALEQASRAKGEFLDGVSHEIRTPMPGVIGRTAEMATAATIGARVLLAEDNVTNQRMGALMLEKLGCRVDVAASGREAIDMLHALPYDVVFMDCQMPEVDGYAATAEIRRSEARSGRRVPIVAMTAGAMAGQRDKCLAAGMDDCISTPVDKLALTAAVHRWAGGKADTVAPVLDEAASGALKGVRDTFGEKATKRTTATAA